MVILLMVVAMLLRMPAMIWRVAMKWPAMTMTFATSGPGQMRGFKRGDKVNFRFEQKDGGPRITGISRSSGQ